MFTQKIRAYVVLLAFKDYLREDLKVLDIECGNGIITKLIEKKFGCYIVGADVLDYAKGIKFRKIKDPYKLPFNNKSFDYALLIDTLHHIDNQKKAILEALRVANRVLIYDIEPGFWAWFADSVLNYITNKEMEKTFTQRTIREWDEFFNELNLDYKRIKFKKPLWYPLPQFAYQIRRR